MLILNFEISCNLYKTVKLLFAFNVTNYLNCTQNYYLQKTLCAECINQSALLKQNKNLNVTIKSAKSRLINIENFMFN